MSPTNQVSVVGDKKGFYKKLFAMVIPLAFQNFMSAAVSASDAIMLGFLEQDALSAVSLAGQITFVFNLFMMILTIGTTMLAAQYWGKGDRSTVEKILAFAMKLSAGVGVIFFCATLFVPQLLMRIFTNDPILITMGVEYLRVVGLSYLFTSISQIYLCIMKNSGRTTKSTIIGSSAMVLNVIFNSFLIFGLFMFPAMGIAGAALATVIARAIEMVWTLIESTKKDSIKLRIKYFLHMEKDLRSDYIKYTLPVVGNYLVWGCGFTMYSVIMGHLGSDAVAANSIANIIKNLIICVCSGIGTAGSILVGNELGRGKIQEGIECGKKVTLLAAISGVCSGVLLLLLSPLILRFASLTPEANTYLKGMLLMCSYYMLGKSINSTVIGGIFCAGGDAKFGFHCDTIVMWIIIIPISLLAAFYWKLPVPVVYFILSMDEFIKLPAVFIHFRKYGWAEDLTRETDHATS